MDKDVADLIVGVLGGTGDQGRGLAYRLDAAGHRVIIGSRSAERAQAAAAELGGTVRGMTNPDAACEADVVIVAVPWEGHRDLLVSLAGPLAGKIVIDCVNPMGFDKRGRVPAPGPGGKRRAAGGGGPPGQPGGGGVPPRVRGRAAGPGG